MQETRRQHTVSKFYLKGFADGRDQISRIALPGDQRIKLSVNDATVIKDFYSLELPNRHRSDVFEQMFAQVEGPASQALAAIVGGKWPLNAQEKEAFGFWVALQALRGEEVRASQTHMNGEFIRLIVGTSGKEALRTHIERSVGRPVDDAELDVEWQDLTKPGGPSLAPDPAAHIRLVLEVAPGFAAYLRDCHWMLHTFERKSLVTSDHPVSMDERDRGPHGGIGLFTADLFLLALTRRLALTIQPRHSLKAFTPHPESAPDFTVVGTAASANSFNQHAVREARRYVYLHPEDTLDDRIHFPAPVTRSRMQASNIDGLVSEEGLFTQEAPVRVPGPKRAERPDGSHKDGITLSDLPWPIPGRMPPAQ